METAGEAGAVGTLRGWIAVIVGITGTGLPFVRLVDALAAYAQSSREEVWIQHGTAPLVPPLRGASTVPRDKLLEQMRRADAIVTHAGCGSIADVFSTGHVPVVVARRERYGEHVNDHQLELLEVLEDEDRIVAVHDMSELGAAIARARSMGRRVSHAVPGKALKQAVRQEIGAWADPSTIRPRSQIVWSVMRAATFWFRPHRVSWPSD